MKKLHLWPESPVEKGDTLMLAVTLEHQKEIRKLVYEVPIEQKIAVTDSCDPYVVATILLAMSLSADIVVHGRLSPSLLDNLNEFQSAWHCWQRDLTPVKIIANQLSEASAAVNNQAIVAFSGGVDSCFSLYRHHASQAITDQQQVSGALMVHGFDIPYNQKEIFQKAAVGARSIVESLPGVRFISVATNFRWVVPYGWPGTALKWEIVYGTALAAALMLFQAQYRIGLMGSSLPYNDLILPWGSNPITDPMLSNRSFQLIHDGAGFNRLEKVAAIAHWSAALNHLRVCWQGENLAKNCGKCEKCIRTILNFKVNGIDCPPAFEQDVSEAKIQALQRIGKVPLTTELQPILEAANAKANHEPWVRALRQTIQKSHRYWEIKKFKQTIKSLVTSSKRP
ncbi:MAG: hypothetical protein AAFQ40_01980 [Cyanobacteria bacterium J06623_5]